MLKNKYSLDNIFIEPNYTDKWTHNAPKDNDFIMLNEVDGTNCLSFDLQQAKFIRDSLNEIIVYYENMPSVGDFVEVINGIFKGYFGKIFDVDICDSKRPLAIRLDDNPEFNDCTCFVGFADVKKANN